MPMEEKRGRKQQKPINQNTQKTQPQKHSLCYTDKSYEGMESDVEKGF